MNHVMLDLETLGTAPGSAILSIGAVVFDLDGALGASFYANIDGASCIDAGLKTDPQTVKWWRSQSLDAREALQLNKRPLSEVVADFGTWFSLNRGHCVWAQGANFDPPLWEAACRAIGKSPPWRYWNARDTRTVYDICGFDAKAFPRGAAAVYHNALDDAKHQVACLAAALRLRSGAP